MKIINSLLLFSLLFVVSSCSKPEKNYTVETVNGIKTYKNKNIPADSKFKIEPKELFTIQGSAVSDSAGRFSDPYYLCSDTNSNIYILDKFNCSVKKFDKSGGFIRSFGGKGQGPGEMTGPMSLMFNNEIIYIMDLDQQKVHTFSVSGDYTKSLETASNNLRFITPINENKFIGFKRSYSDDGKTITHELMMSSSKTDQTFTFEKQVLKNDIKDYQLNNYYNAFAISKDKIYVSKYGSNNYEIDVYNLEGSLLYRIRKDYREIQFTETELKEFQTQENNFVLKYGGEPYEIKFAKKKAINNLYVDNKDRLWVVKSVERADGNKKFVFDVFKDGVFINTISLDNFLAGKDYFIDDKLFFIKDKIYLIDNANQFVRVYQY